MRRTTAQKLAPWTTAALLACSSSPRVADDRVEPPPECITNGDCLAKDPGYASICRKTDLKCVRLETAECPKLLGDREALASKDVVVLGALTPAGTSELGDVMEAAIGLAQRELTTPERPIVVLSCHELNPDGTAGLLRAAEHLVKDAQVPVVLGPSEAASMEKVARQVTLPNDTLLVSTAAASVWFEGLQSGLGSPLVWRTQWSDTQAVHLLNRFIADALVPKLKKDGVLGATEPLRVAILTENEPYGRVLREQLTWNTAADGRPARCADNALLDPPACSYVEFGSLTDTEENPNPESGIARALTQVYAESWTSPGLRPHLVVHAYSSLGLSRVLFPLEAGWDQGDAGGNVAHPYHVAVIPELNASQPLYASFVPFQENATHAGPAPYKPLSQRIFGILPHATRQSADVDAYLGSFKTAYPDFQASSTPGDVLPRQVYDAMYLAYYAIAANGTKPITGSNLATTLPHLVAGEAVRVGPADRDRAVALLAAGQWADVQGVSGDLDLDVETGARAYSTELSCMGVAAGTTPSAIGHGGPYEQFVPSGFFYDELGGDLVGTLPGRCPTLTDAVPADAWPSP